MTVYICIAYKATGLTDLIQQVQLLDVQRHAECRGCANIGETGTGTEQVLPGVL